MTNTSAYLTHPHRREAEAERQRCLRLPGTGALSCPSGTHLQNDWHPFPALPACLVMRHLQSFFRLSACAVLLGLVGSVQPGMAQVTASAWSWNYFGQLGNDGDTNRVHIDTSTPVPVINLTGLERTI